MRRSVATAAPPRASTDAPAARGVEAALDTLVVVGNGMVGHRLCRQLVDLGGPGRFRIVVFGEETYPAYDRVHLTDVLNGRDEDDLLLASAAWYEDRHIDLRLGDPVVEIDRERRLVRSASGAEERYSRLVLATGSAPYIPPIDGAHLPGVCVYRTFGDLRAMQARARRATTAAVIGGGLLGLEAARALQRLGLSVTVLEAAAGLMPAQLDQRGGEALEAQVRAVGIEVRTAATIKRIEVAGQGHRVHVAAGGHFTVDMVVIAAGVRPRTELARRCRLTTCPDGGIIVNDALETSDPRIVAIGECASHRSRIYGLAAPGYEMADTLARRLCGQEAAFRGSEPSTRLKLLGVHVATAGEPLGEGYPIRFSTSEGYRLLRVDGGRLVGVLGVGDWPEFARLQDAVARRTRVWPWQTARFERTGVLWRERSDVLPVGDWPSDTVVCNCMNVTRGQLTSARRAGAATPEALADRTAASTLCGSCRPLLIELCGAAPAAARLAPGLLIASLVAMAAAIALAVAAPVPFAESIADTTRLEWLWRDGGARQASGFTLLGLALAAALLSARKRWRRTASFGGFASWRFAHAVIGVLTLAALAVHTGGRTGDNLNFALVSSFGTLNVLGAIAGGASALEQRLGGRRGRAFRAALVTAHILAIWPLPVLIAFHVLSVYYF